MIFVFLKNSLYLNTRMFPNKFFKEKAKGLFDVVCFKLSSDNGVDGIRNNFSEWFTMTL